MRDYLDNSNRVNESDKYFSFSGMSAYYEDGVSSHVGSASTTPGSGNYYSTTYGYDERGRKNKVTNPLGTITRSVYDGLNRVKAIWVGTSDSSWSDSSGGGNMTKLLVNQYDSYADDLSSSVGDGMLTRVTQIPDSTVTDERVTLNYFDWRDRLVATKSAALVNSSGALVPSSETDAVHRPITYCDLDNLGRCIGRYRYDGDTVTITATSGVPDMPSSSLLRAETVSNYDDQNRVYKTQVYSVDQSAGTLSTYTLQSNTWYDHRGNVIKSAPPALRSPRWRMTAREERSSVMRPMAVGTAVGPTPAM